MVNMQRCMLPLCCSFQPFSKELQDLKYLTLTSLWYGFQNCPSIAYSLAFTKNSWLQARIKKKILKNRVETTFINLHYLKIQSLHDSLLQKLYRGLQIILQNHTTMSTPLSIKIN